MSPLCVAQSLCSCSVCKHPMKCPRYSLSGIWDSGCDASGRKMRDEKKEELCKKIRGGCIETPKFIECQTRRTCVVEIEKRLVFACVQTLGLVFSFFFPFYFWGAERGVGLGYLAPSAESQQSNNIRMNTCSSFGVIFVVMVIATLLLFPFHILLDSVQTDLKST